MKEHCKDQRPAVTDNDLPLMSAAYLSPLLLAGGITELIGTMLGNVLGHSLPGQLRQSLAFGGWAIAGHIDPCELLCYYLSQ